MVRTRQGDGSHRQMHRQYNGFRLVACSAPRGRSCHDWPTLRSSTSYQKLKSWLRPKLYVTIFARSRRSTGRETGFLAFFSPERSVRRFAIRGGGRDQEPVGRVRRTRTAIWMNPPEDLGTYVLQPSQHDPWGVIHPWPSDSHGMNSVSAGCMCDLCLRQPPPGRR